MEEKWDEGLHLVGREDVSLQWSVCPASTLELAELHCISFLRWQLPCRHGNSRHPEGDYS